MALSRNQYIWGKTMICYLLFISLGSIVAIAGPTIKYLEQNMVDNNDLSMIFVFRPCGFFVGAFSGLIFDRLERPELLIILKAIGMSIFNVLIAYVKKTYLIYALFFCLGICLQCVNIGTNVIILNLWGSEAAGIYQGLHFAFSFGALTSPLIASIFLSTSEYIDEIYITISLMNLLILSVLIAFVILTWQIKQEFAATNNDKHIEVKNISIYRNIILFGNIIIATFLQQSMEISFSQLVVPFAHVTEYEMPERKSTYLAVAFWTPFMVTRFLAIFLSGFIKSLHFIIHDISIVILGGLLAATLAYKKEWALWTATVMIGWGMGTLFPSVITWISRYLEITFSIGSLFFVAGSFAEMLIPTLLLRNINNLPSSLYVYVSIASLFTTLFYISLFFLLRQMEIQKKEINKDGGKELAVKP